MLVINCFFLLLFMGFILLFEYLPSENTQACGGRVYEPLPDWTPRRIVNAVYRVIIAALATLLAGLLLFYTGKVYVAVRGHRRVRRTQVINTYKIVILSTSLNLDLSPPLQKIFILASICSIGLLAQSSYLIFLVTSSDQHNVTTISILIASEIVPSCLILFLLHPGRNQKKSFLHVLLSLDQPNLTFSPPVTTNIPSIYNVKCSTESQQSIDSSSDSSKIN